MRFFAQRIWVDDLAAARTFYGGVLGLELAWDYGGAALGYVVGEATLIIEVTDRSTEKGAKLVGRFVGCSLEVADIQAEYVRLAALGVPFPMPPEPRDWGGILADFTDPAGNVLTLVEIQHPK